MIHEVRPLAGRVFLLKLPVKPSLIELVDSRFGEVTSPIGMKHANSPTDQERRIHGGPRVANLGRVLAVHPDDATGLGIAQGMTVVFDQEAAAHDAWVEYRRAEELWYSEFAAMRIAYRCREYERECGTLEDFARLCRLHPAKLADVVERRRLPTAGEVQYVTWGIQAAIQSRPGTVKVPESWTKIHPRVRGEIITAIVPEVTTPDDLAVPRPPKPHAWILEHETDEQREAAEAAGRMMAKGLDTLTDTASLCALFGMELRPNAAFVTVCRASAVVAEWVGELPTPGEMA